MSLEVDIPVIKEIRVAGMIVEGEMNTTENQATLQSTEMRGEVDRAEGTVDEIETIMELGGDIMMEGEIDVEAGAGRTTEGEAGTRMTKEGAETGTRREGASLGREGGAGAEVGRGETLKTGQEVGGVGTRREGEVEEGGIGTGDEEEEEDMRRGRGAERRENRNERSRLGKLRRWESKFPSTSSQEESSQSAMLNRLFISLMTFELCQLEVMYFHEDE